MVEGVEMYVPILNEFGECVANNIYSATFIFRNAAKFAYVTEKEEHIVLECSYYLNKVSADPNSMELAMDGLIEDANYQSRFAILNKPRRITIIWPAKLKRWKGYYCTEPLNLFPISASGSYDGQFLEVTLNTSKGRGAIVELRFPADNVFGMNELLLGYEKTSGKFKTRIIPNSRSLGVLDQHCTITSGDLHFSRTLVTPELNNQCLVAVFPSEQEVLTGDQPYLTLNRLSSSCTYDRILFKVFSTHRNENFQVSNEKFSYLLCWEIRGYT